MYIMSSCFISYFVLIFGYFIFIARDWSSIVGGWNVFNYYS